MRNDNKNFKMIPIYVVMGFVLNILVVSSYLYFNGAGKFDYLITLFVGSLLLVPSMIFFISFYKLLKKGLFENIQFENLIKNGVRTSLVLGVLCSMTYLVAIFITTELRVLIPMMVLSIWCSTAIFVYLNLSLIKPHITRLPDNTDETEDMNINPANGAPMIGDSGIDVLGNPYGISGYHNDSSGDCNNQNYK